jgi:hypothetical protein
MKDPNKLFEENEDDFPIDADAQEVAESLDGFKEYQKEARGDSLTYGDY